MRDHCQGTTCYGLLASSGALRLKPEGIYVKNEISVANWFLNGKNDVRSSYYLKYVVSEFDIQGLELDYSIVAWDADYRFENGNGATTILLEIVGITSISTKRSSTSKTHIECFSPASARVWPSSSLPVATMIKRVIASGTMKYIGT